MLRMVLGLIPLRLSGYLSPHACDMRNDIERATRVLGASGLSDVLTRDDVRRYYRCTTDRDYRWLQWFVGPGLHTVLRAAPPIGFQGLGTRQPLLVLTQVDTACHARARVLEVGCGRGHCTLFLAGVTGPNVKFDGLDLLGEHVLAADEANVHGSRVRFHVGDAHSWDPPEGVQYDVIFGCESMCHLDPDAFAKRAARMMGTGARLVIIDGFRGRGWDDCGELPRIAMRMAERGFRVNAMATKDQWVSACEEQGLGLVEDIDLTEEATPFWTLGWRLASWALRFPSLVRAYMGSSPERRETVSNLVACAMVAHALRGGAAEYGMLVFEKGCWM